MKPLPIVSAQRSLLFGMHIAKTGIRVWKNQVEVMESLRRDTSFLNRALGNPLVDYSMLTSVFYVNHSSVVGMQNLNLPNCAECLLSEVNGYGFAKGSILICFSIIDMLMQFGVQKMFENALLFW